MFLGTYTPKLDEKGRLIFPAKFQGALEGGPVVTRTQERVLTVYPKDTSEAPMVPMGATPSMLKQVRDYQCMLIAGASFEVPGRQGWIATPPILRPYVGLERNVVMIDVINRTETWDAEYWAEYQTKQESDFTELDAEPLSQLGQRGFPRR